MRILGIDPGYAILGWGVIDTDGGKHTVIDYGVIETPKEEAIGVRLNSIYESLSALIENFKPNHIAVEQLFFFKNQKTIIPVAEARGIILLAGYHFCGNVFEYTPLQIKQALTGVGRAEKKQVQFMVKAILGLDAIPKPDDAADALAVAITHSQFYGNGNYSGHI